MLSISQYLLGGPAPEIEGACTAALDAFAVHGAGAAADKALQLAAAAIRRAEGGAPSVLPSVSKEKRIAVAKRLDAFCVSMAWNPQTTWPKGAYDLASCGARPLMAPTVNKAIAGSNAPYRCAKPVASWANRPLASWSMPSPASCKVVNLTSPGLTKNLPTLLH